MSSENVNTPELPGYFIREELEAREWLQSDLAFILGVDDAVVTKLINGKARITVAIAKALGEAFNVSAEFFTNLQNAYDLAITDNPNPAVATRGRIQDRYPH